MGTIGSSLRCHDLVGLDTSVFIYHLESSAQYGTIAGTIMTDLMNGVFQGITSVLTLMEIAVQPLQLERPGIADRYGILLANYPNLTITNIDVHTARRAAELRAKHRLHPADSLQIASCLQHGATAFVTNDKRLRRLVKIDILLLDDFTQDQLP